MIIRNRVLPKILRILAILKQSEQCDTELCEWFQSDLVRRLPKDWVEGKMQLPSDIHPSDIEGFWERCELAEGKPGTIIKYRVKYWFSWWPIRDWVL